MHTVPDAVDEEDEVAVGGPDDADAVALLQLVEVRAVVLVDAAAVAQDRVAGHYPGWRAEGPTCRRQSRKSSNFSTFASELDS